MITRETSGLEFARDLTLAGGTRVRAGTALDSVLGEIKGASDEWIEKQLRAGHLRDGSQVVAPEPEETPVGSVQNEPETSEDEDEATDEAGNDSGETPDDEIAITPAARELAEEHGILIADLEGKGTGKDGKIGIDDVRKEIKARSS